MAGVTHTSPDVMLSGQAALGITGATCSQGSTVDVVVPVLVVTVVLVRVAVVFVAVVSF